MEPTREGAGDGTSGRRIAKRRALEGAADAWSEPPWSATSWWASERATPEKDVASSAVDPASSHGSGSPGSRASRVAAKSHASSDATRQPRTRAALSGEFFA